MIALATRGSALALVQTGLVIAALRARFPDQEFTSVVVESDGDLSPSTLAPDLPGQGWFTSRLERAVQEGRVDGAVHSAKDLPSELAPDLVLAGFLARADPRDALVAGGDSTLLGLAQGALVGTSSPRRATQLLALRPDLRVETIRGNVDTRVRKVREGQFDACVVALAGLIRIDREYEGSPLDPMRECTPAPAQGAIAMQARVGSEFAAMAAAIDDQRTRRCVEAERLVLIQMGGGCRLPLGTLAQPIDESQARLTVAWCEAPGAGVRRFSQEASWVGLRELAVAMAQELR